MVEKYTLLVCICLLLFVWFYSLKRDTSMEWKTEANKREYIYFVWSKMDGNGNSRVKVENER